MPDPSREETAEEAELCAAANMEIDNVSTPKGRRKRGTYGRYNEKQRLEIATYTCDNGPAKSSRHFTALFGHPVNESTVRAIRYAYRKKLRTANEPMTSLPKMKTGRPTVLPSEVDAAVQRHLRKIRLAGGVVNKTITMATGRGIVASKWPSLLRENGGHADLGRGWAGSILERMQFVKRKGTKAGRKVPANLDQLRDDFHQRIQRVVRECNIPGEEQLFTIFAYHALTLSFTFQHPW